MSSSIQAKAVRFDQNSFWVALSEGRIPGIPLEWFPRLQKATDEERKQVRISTRGLHGEALNEDFSIAGLLEGDRTGSPTVFVV